MGFLQSIFQGQEKKKHGLGVCIPDSSKARIAGKEAEEPISADKTFSVSGIFQVQDSLMLQGRVFGRAVKKKDRVSVEGTKLVVKDLQVGRKSVDSIKPGEKGALFLKAEKGKFPIVKIGDRLQF